MPGKTDVKDVIPRSHPRSRSTSRDNLADTSDSSSDNGADEDEDNRGSDEEREIQCLKAEAAKYKRRTKHQCIAWTGYGKRTPILLFRAEVMMFKIPEVRDIGERYHLAYKMVKTESKLVRSVLSSHGFHEVHPNSNDFNLMWTGSHLKPYILKNFLEHQKINHFPRSYEVTRKDRLYKNIQRMQQIKGFRHFDFVPQSFIIPGEFHEFCSAYLKDKGPWIVKPIASSRGRGIFLVNHPEQVPLDETMIVSKYLHNPYLVDGFKFDIRLYIGVTSYDPLTIYFYEEGLVRFATVKYDRNARNIRNQCMHLTNYSVNKKNTEYVKNDDPDVEDYGNKWSLGALLRYMRSQGVDTTALMLRVEDVIIKTLLSAELAISTACKMFMPYRGNCFEVYGFDILLDENLRPWILEVNLSPSLACDSPLDLKIKSNMMADLFSLTGFICQDPLNRKPTQARQIPGISRSNTRAQKKRPSSANLPRSQSRGPGSGSSLTGEEIRMVRRCKEENLRRGGFVRIFPTPDSWDLYGSYFQSSSSHNFTLYSQLYPDRAQNLTSKASSASHSSSMARSKTLHLHSSLKPSVHLMQNQLDDVLVYATQRALQYERKLSSLGSRKLQGRRRPPEGEAHSDVYKGTLVQGVVQQGSSQPSSSSIKQSLSTKSSTSADSLSDPVLVSLQGNGDSIDDIKTLHKPIKKEILKANPTRQEETSSKLKQPTPNNVQQTSGRGAERVKTAFQPAQELHLPSTSRQKSKTGEKMDVVSLLESGHTLSKVQARFAFAMYLTRVQQRLVLETTSIVNEDTTTANEQMDLVLRFLKRAAANLQQTFKVTVPSRKMLLSDRRRILAKQLGEFVEVYEKETDQLHQRTLLEKKHMKRPPSFSKNEGLNEADFKNYVHSASENDLEEVLTTYTKLNKSASIFLGSNAKSSYERPTSSNANRNVPRSATSESQLARRREMADHSEHSRGYSRTSSRPSSSINPNAANQHKGKYSAERERPDGAESQPLTQVEDDSINTALQRLAVRQQQRQYDAKASNLLVTGPARPSSKGQHVRNYSWNGTANDNLNADVSSCDQDTPYNPNNAGIVDHEMVASNASDTQMNSDGRSPPTTISGFVEYDEAELQHQKMVEQSRAMLEQSKAKHQAMIAQAHAASKMHSARSKPDDSVQVFVPRPPSNKKPTANRVNRAANIHDETQDIYSKIKYDHARGTSRVVYNEMTGSDEIFLPKDEIRAIVNHVDVIETHRKPRKFKRRRQAKKSHLPIVEDVQKFYQDQISTLKRSHLSTINTNRSMRVRPKVCPPLVGENTSADDQGVNNFETTSQAHLNPTVLSLVEEADVLKYRSGVNHNCNMFDRFYSNTYS